ncbi:Hypothetical_protein [Hexamita inflata]|uniref:Hypothetical_protein n=1 Tax=Hexamita inflata TaxID=28002 RepID=A0AA86TVR1_9EUKA|nr:Hypothetical protein HINF_LOCUS18420 [Hexamita inflata]
MQQPITNKSCRDPAGYQKVIDQIKLFITNSKQASNVYEQLDQLALRISPNLIDLSSIEYMQSQTYINLILYLQSCVNQYNQWLLQSNVESRGLSNKLKNHRVRSSPSNLNNGPSTLKTSYVAQSSQLDRKIIDQKIINMKRDLADFGQNFGVEIAFKFPVNPDLQLSTEFKKINDLPSMIPKKQIKNEFISNEQSDLHIHDLKTVVQNKPKVIQKQPKKEETKKLKQIAQKPILNQITEEPNLNHQNTMQKLVGSKYTYNWRSNIKQSPEKPKAELRPIPIEPEPEKQQIQEAMVEKTKLEINVNLIQNKMELMKQRIDTLNVIKQRYNQYWLHLLKLRQKRCESQLTLINNRKQFVKHVIALNKLEIFKFNMKQLTPRNIQQYFEVYEQAKQNNFYDINQLNGYISQIINDNKKEQINEAYIKNLQLITQKIICSQEFQTKINISITNIQFQTCYVGFTNYLADNWTSQLFDLFVNLVEVNIKPLNLKLAKQTIPKQLKTIFDQHKIKLDVVLTVLIGLVEIGMSNKTFIQINK